MAGDEVRALDEVGGADRLGTESQVGHGDRARLLGVVDEVALGEEVGALADDLHRRLVGADGAVRAKPEEHGLDFAGRSGVVELGVDRQAEVGDVVVDADREVLPGLRGGELIEDGLDHRRRDFLRGQAVAPADDPRDGLERRLLAVHALGDGGHDLEVERLAYRAGLLGPVQDGDGAHRRGQRRDELVDRERLEQPHLQDADLLARGHERIDGFLDGADGGSHHDDHALGVRGAVVVDQPVAAAGPGGELVHHFLDDAGQRQVVGVRGLAGLEEGIGVLGGAAHDRGVRREAAAAEGQDVLIADQGPHVVVF